MLEGVIKKDVPPGRAVTPWSREPRLGSTVLYTRLLRANRHEAINPIVAHFIEISSSNRHCVKCSSIIIMQCSLTFDVRVTDPADGYVGAKHSNKTWCETSPITLFITLSTQKSLLMLITFKFRIFFFN